MGNQERAGILVPERFIPTPTTVSPQAQTFLSNPLPFGETSMPAPADKAGWRDYIERTNSGLTAYMSSHAKLFPAETKTHKLASAPLYEITPRNISPKNEKRAILYIHGGGFIVGHGEAAIYAALQIASLTQTRTYSVDYRMPPDHPFPDGLNDTVDAYRWLLARYTPGNIGLFGASAGGNLVPACVLKARDVGLPLPAVCAVHSPAADLTESGDTFQTNAIIDIVLKRGSPDMLALYAGGHDLRDPLLSPVFGDFNKGFPPTILTSGTRDLLLSSTVMLHRALRRAGIEAELHVWEAMTHGTVPDAPEAKELMDEHVQFMLAHMGTE
jgi:epsilon-lactone hydrolase